MLGGGGKIITSNHQASIAREQKQEESKANKLILYRCKLAG